MENIEKRLNNTNLSEKEKNQKLILTSILGSDKIVSLGVDQGYANLGYSVVEYDIITEEIYVKKFGTITTSSKEELNKRFLKIYNLIKEVILETSEISLIGCEKLFHNKPMNIKDKSNPFATRNKSASIMKANMVTGILFLISAQTNHYIKEFAPTSVKKYITGNGRAKKDELETALKEIIDKQGIKIKTDHESDSIGIAITVIKDYLSNLLKEYNANKTNQKLSKNKNTSKK